MYALARGPSKIVASTRRGTRPLEIPENSRDQAERVDSKATMSAVARPVFNHNHNGRIRNQPRTTGYGGYMNANHQEVANFMQDNWNRAMRDYSRRGSGEGGPEWYRQREPNPAYANFKKFDLEEYWGKKTMRRLTESS